MPFSKNRILMVSNRLPISIERDADGYHLNQSSGGLVTALGPILEETRGVWVGWPGSNRKQVRGLIKEYNRGQSYRLVPVMLNSEEAEKYYRGFSNETIWPLFHDFLGSAIFSQDTWDVYRKVNHRFAEITFKVVQPEDFVWIHDYQLILVGERLRNIGYAKPLAFYLHIPFPAPDLFRRLPWKDQIMRAFLQYNLLGFQTQRDLRNFIGCARSLIPEVQIHHHRNRSQLSYGSHHINAGNYPVSIDFDGFDSTARTGEVKKVVENLRRDYHRKYLILGLDRLDYTKGIPERFLAYENFLEHFPEFHERVTLIQVVVPSRTRVKRYAELKERLDSLTGRINGRFSTAGWVPLHYHFKHLDRTELVAHYRACDVALITPLRDGMNLIAKEYCASNVDLEGVLILSEFAGAADGLAKDALLVNPYDVRDTAMTLYRALTMGKEERKRRMRRLRSTIKRNNVFRWVTRFVQSMD